MLPPDPLTQAIRRGQNFYQYAESIGLKEAEHPRLYMVTKLAFEVKEQEYQHPRKSRTQWIVLTTHGTNPEPTKFVLHGNMDDASTHGRQTLGARHYTLKEWAKYKNTADYKACLRIQKGATRWQQIKSKRKIPSIPTINTDNNKSILNVKEIKGERLRLYRLKLKARSVLRMEKKYLKNSQSKLKT